MVVYPTQTSASDSWDLQQSLRGDSSEAQPPRAGHTNNPAQNGCPGMKRCSASHLLLQAKCRVSCCSDSKADCKHLKAEPVFGLLREVSGLSTVL